jgi:hypothetical protein
MRAWSAQGQARDGDSDRSGQNGEACELPADEAGIERESR